jgi:hypothetical protein
MQSFFQIDSLLYDHLTLTIENNIIINLVTVFYLPLLGLKATAGPIFAFRARPQSGNDF